MTGLFHRLARQVVGPALPRARSAARLPYTAPPPPEPIATILQSTAVMETSATVAPRVDAAPEPPRPRAKLQAPRTVATPRADTDRQPSGGAADECLLAEPVAHADAANARSGRVGPPIEEAQPSGAIPPPWPESADRRAALGRVKVPEPAVTRAEPPPPPLLPAVAVSETAATARAQERESGRSTPAAKSPPEVHVHIGRIEVSAAAEPQPAARERPRRGREPMSLEQYLAKRSGRS